MWRGQQKPNRTEPKPTFCELRRSGEKSEREARSKVSRTSLFCSWRPPVGAGLGSGSNKIRKKKRATPVICCLGSKGISKNKNKSHAELGGVAISKRLVSTSGSRWLKRLAQNCVFECELRRGLTLQVAQNPEQRGPFLGETCSICLETTPAPVTTRSTLSIALRWLGVGQVQQGADFDYGC